MRILQVINSLDTGGAEKLLLETIPKCIDKDIEMELLLLDGTLHPFLKILKKQSDCKIHILGKGSVYNPFLIFKIIPYFKKYDIIHVHLFPSLYWVAFAKMFSSSKVTLLYTEHSTRNKRRTFLLKYLDRWVYKQFTKIISISPQVQDILQKHLGFKDEIFVMIENGVPISVIKDANPLTEIFFPNQKNDILLIQVSRFFYPKDQETVIKALKQLPENFKLLLVGDGKKIKDCKKLTRRLKLQKRVKFLGIRNDVPNLLKTVNAVILSSHYEGLSLSCIEGMASGKPLLASRVTGLTPLVEGAGILFEAQNEIDLSYSLMKLFKDKDHYFETVKACKKRAQKYDINTTIVKLIRLYSFYVQT